MEYKEITKGDKGITVYQKDEKNIIRIEAEDDNMYGDISTLIYFDLTIEEIKILINILQEQIE